MCKRVVLEEPETLKCFLIVTLNYEKYEDFDDND